MRTKSDDELLSIGAVADRTGIAPSALRFYEREGLVTSTRTDGAQRRYDRDVLRRLAFIRVAQTVGLGLPEIRDALATLPASARPTRRTGTESHAPGGPGSTSRSTRSSGCVTSSPSASAAGACRCAAARSTTPRTGPPVSAAAPASSSATSPPTCLHLPSDTPHFASGSQKSAICADLRVGSLRDALTDSRPHGRPHPPHLRRRRRDDHERQPGRPQRVRRRHGRGALRRVRRAARAAPTSGRSSGGARARASRRAATSARSATSRSSSPTTS